MGMGLDRSVLRDAMSELSFNIEDHPAFECDPRSSSPIPTKVHPFEATAAEIPVLLRMSAASVAQLKTDATPEGARPISTHDALTALVWRSVILIRSRRSSLAKEIPASTITNIFMPSDARRHLHLPESYVGNAVYQLTADLDLGTLLSSSGLQQAAKAIRQAILAVNPNLVNSYMSKLKEEWVDWRFMSSYATTGVAMGTDWGSGLLYALDWGKEFGPLVKYRFPGVDGFTSILPKLPDGAAELVVGILPEEERILKGSECFGNYLEG
jgi:hypothetical protein